MDFTRSNIESTKNFIKEYFNYLAALLNNLDTSILCEFIQEMERARLSGNTVFIVGNGGSAATASHMANDLGAVALKGGGNARPLRALSLTDNHAFGTAIANDDGYDQLFVNQLRIHYRKDDRLIAISASGNSPNVVKAAKWVRSHGGRVIGLLGFDGGELKECCNIPIVVETPKGKYGPVEDVHMILGHLVAGWLMCIDET